jgi:hypothetical protein
MPVLSKLRSRSATRRSNNFRSLSLAHTGSSETCTFGLPNVPNFFARRTSLSDTSSVPNCCRPSGAPNPASCGAFTRPDFRFRFELAAAGRSILFFFFAAMFTGKTKDGSVGHRGGSSRLLGIERCRRVLGDDRCDNVKSQTP